MAETNRKPPLTVRVTSADLPLSCPPLKAKWNLHPRVYLPVPEGASKVSCSYCGTCYVITDRNVNPEKGGSVI